MVAANLLLLYGSYLKNTAVPFKKSVQYDSSVYECCESYTYKPLQRRTGSVPAIGNPGSVPVQAFVICI